MCFNLLPLFPHFRCMFERIIINVQVFIQTHIGIAKSRLIQTIRFLKNLGIIRALICIISIYCMLFVPILRIEKSGYSNLSNLLPILSILLLLNTYRKDKRFLQIVFKKEYMIQSFEYFIITIPFLFFLLSRNEIILAIIFEFTIILLCYVQKKVFQKRFRQYIPNIKIPINSLNYEWIAGLKSNIVVLILLNFIVITLIFSLRVPYVFYFYVGIMYLIISSFYTEFEPWAFLYSRGHTYTIFFIKTITLHIRAFYSLLLPICFIQLLLFHSLLDILIVFWTIISSAMYIILLVLMKYAIYKPNKKIIVTALTNIFWGVISLIPFCIPITLFFGLNRYRKGLINLSIYFHD